MSARTSHTLRAQPASVAAARLALTVCLCLVAIVPGVATAGSVLRDSARYSYEWELFPTVHIDTDWVGLKELSARVIVDLGSNVQFDLPGQAALEWPAGTLRIDGTADAGFFSMNFGAQADARLKIDIDLPPIIDYYWEDSIPTPIGEAFDWRFYDEAEFTPYLLPGNGARPVLLSDGTDDIYNYEGDWDFLTIELDLTDLVIPIPGIGGGLSLAATPQLDMSLRGDRIATSGGDITSEGGATSVDLPASGVAPVPTTWHGNLTASPGIHMTPGVYVSVLGFRWDVPAEMLQFTVPLPGVDKDLALEDDLSFTMPTDPAGPAPTSIQLSASLSPSSGVPPYTGVTVSGSATYNTDRNSDGALDPVPVGSVRIDTGDDVYTAAIAGGVFERMVSAPGSSRNITIAAQDDVYGLSASVSEYLSIRSDGGTGGYDLTTAVVYEWQGDNNEVSWSPKDAFRSTDDRVALIAVFSADGASFGHTYDLMWRFYSPDGTQYGSDIVLDNFVQSDWNWAWAEGHTRSRQ